MNMAINVNTVVLNAKFKKDMMSSVDPILVDLM